MLAEQEAVVAGEEEHRVVELAQRAQRLVDSPDAVVDREDRREVDADELVEVLRSVQRAVDAVPRLDTLLHPVGLAVPGDRPSSGYVTI